MNNQASTKDDLLNGFGIDPNTGIVVDPAHEESTAEMPSEEAGTTIGNPGAADGSATTTNDTGETKTDSDDIGGPTLASLALEDQGIVSVNDGKQVGNRIDNSGYDLPITPGHKITETDYSTQQDFNGRQGNLSGDIDQTQFDEGNVSTDSTLVDGENPGDRREDNDDGTGSNTNFESVSE